ncbi:MAG: gliding motility-associated C-terminal domain-containing protein [Saprospiraceae bacterium]|nr:gliding motility-associated C-terminal domain-containing protein [Saprospiraceae bacterium]
MFRFFWLPLLCLHFIGSSQAQRLTVSYLFDGCQLQSTDSRAENLKNTLPLECDCGVDGESVVLNAQTLEFPISLDSFFENDFSLCFSFLPEPFTGEMDLFSKSNNCLADTLLDISLRSRDSTFQINLKRGLDRNLFLTAPLDPTSCWQNFCLTKNGLDFRVYVNGQLKDRKVAPNLIQLNHGIPLKINASPCQPSRLIGAAGKLDRIVVANYGFDARKVDSLYLRQQKILTQDTVIFLGDQFNIRTASHCPGSIQWTPITGLDNPNSFFPLASPTTETIYRALFTIQGCQMDDSVLVRVVDKDQVDCNKILLPTAFTPNQDGLNETIGISNPYLLEKLHHLVIMDRNGGILFETDNPATQWDGQFKNTALATGTYYYRISYQCQGEQYQKKGSFVLLR